MQMKCAESANEINLIKQRNEKLHNTIIVLNQQKLEQRANCSPKRRKYSPRKTQEQRRRNSAQPIDSPQIPESQSSLNLNIALQLDNDEDETITETEPAISPYKPWGTRRKINKRNCENERPDSTISATTTTAAADDQWLGKTPKDKLAFGKTKMSLTIRSKSPKLKQTRLHFDTSKDKDIIESSPNLYTALKQAKNSRSLLQR